MFDENKKLLKFEDGEFSLEVDYQNKNSISQDTINRADIKDSSMDYILDVEYENKKTDQLEGFDLDDSGHIPMLEQLMASSNDRMDYEEDQYEESEDDFVPIGLKKPKPRMYDDSLENIRTVLLDEYEDDFIEDKSDLEDLPINFYNDNNNETDKSSYYDVDDFRYDRIVNSRNEEESYGGNAGKVDNSKKDIDSKKIEQLERIASALERIADMMEKR